MYAATIDLTEPPYGSFTLTFSEDTAESVAELVVGTPVEGDLTGMKQSALQKDTEFQLHIFLVPDPGSFVNIIDKLDIEDIKDEENLAEVYEGEGAF